VTVHLQILAPMRRRDSRLLFTGQAASVASNLTRPPDAHNVDLLIGA
jgi:hypothetical protein